MVLSLFPDFYFRFNERFSVHDAAREYVGYWRGTVQRLTGILNVVYQTKPAIVK